MWAFKRKIIVYIVLFAIVGFFVFRYVDKKINKPPTCFDGIQNGIEEGIDCSGNCKFVCLNKVTPVNGVWAKNFVVGGGVSNILALIENPNFDYQVESEYKIKNIDERGVILNSIEREIILEPGEKQMIFIPSVRTGNAVIARTLIAVGNPKKAEKKERFKNNISVVSKILKTDSLQTQLQVGLKNTDLLPVKNIEVVATLSKKDGEVFDVAKTFVERIDKRETVKVNFTWQKVIDDKDVIIEVYPRVEKD